jgi:hypothetical protein
MKFFLTMKIFVFFLKYMGKIVGAEARVRDGAEIFDMMEPDLEPHKNGPALQHWIE